MGKFAKVILAICVSLIVLLGVAVFFLFNAVKSVTNNPNLIQNPATTVVTQSQQASTSQNASQDSTTTGMDTATTTVSQTQAPTTPSLSQEQAINAALAHAGLTAGNGVFSHAQLDQFDDNIPQLHYDVEIISNGYEYDYKIDAVTGNVLSSVREIHD
ncbi:MAG: PepSY domain-containing protein [Gemella sp.]|nr:PepSY domain-containing protein [Gemella sp.]